ncbi:MAG TPA: hypothetical protein VM680_20505 [Verrucomicrobiae bacterium]|nr:hypothetical protein [Verrucomicrobiae bacterium]
MRSGSTSLLKIAFALSSAAAFSCLRAAESAPAAAPAPEKIEFSRASSTTPKIPRPGAQNEERLNGFGNVFDKASQAPTEMMMPAVPGGGVLSRSAAEKYLREWDKKKNWAIPGGVDEKDTDPFAKADDKKDDDLMTSDRPKSRMEQFMSGEESKRKTPGQARLRDLDRDTDRRNNRSFDSKDRDKRDDRDRNDDNSPRDPNDNSESNGLAEFNLKNFIRQQNGMPTFMKDNPMPRASQLFRSDVGGALDQRLAVEREKAQRDARAAEFSQMIKPRLPGSFVGSSDPINAPDLTRREINPITPRSFDSGPSERPSFGMPAPSPASRIQDNNMLGVTGPAAAAGAPAITAPLPRPDNTRSRQIVIDAPRKIGF